MSPLFCHREKFVIPFGQETCEQNVLIDGSGCHYVDAVVGVDTLKFQLDLGAASTQFSSNYYTRFKERIVEECAADFAMYGGVGGTDSELVYRIGNVEIKACGGSFSKQNVRISTTKKPNEGDESGVIGLDFLLSFNSARLNLRTLYLKVE